MTKKIDKPTTWWGDFQFENEKNKEWLIGPLRLVVRRLSNEWHIAHEPIDDYDNNGVFGEINDTDQLPESLDNNSRYFFREITDQLSITPQLADRPIISRPLTPFNLMAGEEVTLYVSTSLWLQVATGSSPKKTLQTIAIQRLSDTWFGPSTLEGELCYASTTHCRLSFTDLPQRSHRAITPVLIRNKASTTLLIEKLNLPTPLLSLYVSSNDQLWTPQVTLTRQKDGDMAELKIDNQPLDIAGQMLQLSEARNKADNGILFHAFNTFFS